MDRLADSKRIINIIIIILITLMLIFFTIRLLEMSYTGRTVSNSNFDYNLTNSGDIAFSLDAGDNLTDMPDQILSLSSASILAAPPPPNTPPVVSNVTLSSTSGNNLTTDNLTVTFTASDAEGNRVYNITDWRANETSIAVLNMPFDASNNKTKDFTTYSQEVSEQNSPNYRPAGGIVGGAYDFNANNDALIVTDSPSLDITSAITIEAWVYIDKYSNWDSILSKPWNVTGAPNIIYSLGFGNDSNFALLLTSYGTSTNCFSARNPTSLKVWTHIAGIWNGTYMTLYVNGNSSGSPCPFAGPLDTNKENISIGGYKYGKTYDFDGRIDNVKIYNRALSTEQMLANYNQGNPAYTTMASQETEIGDNWTVAVTPADGTDLGAPELSNNVLIRAVSANQPPAKIQLYAPENDSSSPITRPTFMWYNTTDPEGNQLTYNLQVAETYNFSGPLNINKTDIAEGSDLTNYTLEQDLNAKKWYYWRARAYDGTNYSEWSETRSYYVEPLASFTILVSTIDFGFIENNEQKNTTNNNPPPFILENTGNVFLNISLNATGSLWSSVMLNNTNLQFKADDRNEVGSFEKGTSQITFMNVLAKAIKAITKLNYTDITDTGVIDLKITAPPDEPAGSKTTTFIFTAEETT